MMRSPRKEACNERAREAVFRTAKAFNAASNDADWGYRIENEGGTWKVLDREGLVKMWSNDEVMLSRLAPHLVSEIAKRT